MTATAWAGDERLRSVSFTGARWCTQAQLWRPHDPDLLTTGSVETAAILLAGTFDLIGGSTAWPARGARATPFAGRPMAVFLPPGTEFRTQHGSGEILLLSARQPAARPAAAGRAAFAQKPLLPMAGSNKSFDPITGEWLLAEAFPTAPESLPPRRMQRLSVGDVTVERVLAPDYKAATLSVDEAVVPVGATLLVRDIPGRPSADEVLVFVRGEAGDTAFVANDVDGVAITAGGTPSYVVLAYAGKG